MFDSIEQLEKQVQEFQENILASNELIVNIEALTLAVKNQQHGYEQASASLVQEIKEYVVTIEDKSETLRDALAADAKSVLQGTQNVAVGIRTSNEATLKAVAERLSLEISKLNTDTERFIAELKSADESAIDSVVEKLTDSQQDYIKQLESAQSTIEKLIANIGTLTSAVKNQQREYEQASASLVQGIKEYVVAIEDKSETLRDALAADVKSVLQGTQDVAVGIRTSNEATLKAVAERLSLEISKLNTDTERFIAELKSADESAIDSVAEKLTDFQQGYIKQLESAQSAIEKMNQTLNTKYQGFLQRLENTNIDQLFKTYQDMKKSIETKLYLLMAGVGITAVIAILLLLIR